MFTKEVHNSLFLIGNNSHKYWTRSVVRLWERFNEAESQLEIRKKFEKLVSTLLPVLVAVQFDKDDF